MRLKHQINIVIFTVIWYAGYYFWAWDDALIQEFFKVGWENYNGTDIDTPENIYFALLLGATAYALWCFVQTIQKYGIKGWGGIGVVVAGCTFLCAGVLSAADGDFNLKESRFFWQFCCVSNMFFSIAILIKMRKEMKVVPMHHDILDDPNSITNEDV